ncbi:hypothetical protein B0T17DRAFT_400451 [Bombardia bombarda]|uniref:Myb-like domain-containing protein n=1 Tax=Bombardia bombarda TaxID=252184 RepID=A0AA39U069_9PEZI|nr:hypothetical protein B0T17DRAFT_400451 [Bombardia bombarda]
MVVAAMMSTLLHLLIVLRQSRMRTLTRSLTNDHLQPNVRKQTGIHPRPSRQPSRSWVGGGKRFVTGAFVPPTCLASILGMKGELESNPTTKTALDAVRLVGATGRGRRTRKTRIGDDIRPPPPKRRKASSLTTLASLRTRRHLRSHDAASQPQARASASGRTQSGRHNVSRSSQGSINEGNDQVPRAMFEKWSLGNAVLKRVIVDGLGTFQLQFTWDSCATHKREDCTARQPQDKSRAKESRSLRRGGGTPLTPEDNLLVELKSQGLSWKEIHKRFTQAFPDRERSMGSLQVHYCTKVKRRQTSSNRLSGPMCFTSAPSRINWHPKMHTSRVRNRSTRP